MLTPLQFDHFALHVSDLDESSRFYCRAFDLHECGRTEGDAEKHVDASVLLTDAVGVFRLELRDELRPLPIYNAYDRECVFIFRASGDFAEWRARHMADGLWAHDDAETGGYWLRDPDDYELLVVPDNETNR